jgi:hypothetical protein
MSDRQVYEASYKAEMHALTSIFDVSAERQSGKSSAGNTRQKEAGTDTSKPGITLGTSTVEGLCMRAPIMSRTRTIRAQNEVSSCADVS